MESLCTGGSVKTDPFWGVLDGDLILFFQIDKQNEKCGPYEQKNLQIGERIIKVDISDTDCKRELGLSGRKNLLEDVGMLFVFNKEGNYPFWMKEMNFPIDIIWIDENFIIIYIKKELG